MLVYACVCMCMRLRTYLYLYLGTWKPTHVHGACIHVCTRMNGCAVCVCVCLSLSLSLSLSLCAQSDLERVFGGAEHAPTIVRVLARGVEVCVIPYLRWQVHSVCVCVFVCVCVCVVCRR